MFQSDIISELLAKYKTEMATDGKQEKLKKYYGKYGLVHETFEIKNIEVSNIFNKPIGTYVINSFENVLGATNVEFDYLVTHLSNVLKKFLSKKQKLKVLVVALGNRHLTADSLGINTIKNVIVTRHLQKQDKFLNLPEISVIATSVMGVTGIESYNIVKGVINEIKPDNVIVIDTFCANNFKRLGSSFQINNGGIIPGGGIDNPQPAISKETTNVEVICVGVPLVVYASSFVKNAIEDIGYDTADKSVVKVVDMLQGYDYKNMITTTHDIEDLVKMCGKVLGYAINKALTGYSIDEQKNILEER